MKKILTLSFIAFLIFSACDTKKAQGDNENYNTQNFDEPFKLNSSKGVKMKDDDLKISFVAVKEDSRCPEGTTCVWEGQVKVLLKIESGEKSTDIEIEKKGKSTEASLGNTENYQILLLEVNPYPKEEQKLKLEDYNLTLAVQRK